MVSFLVEMEGYRRRRNFGFNIPHRNAQKRRTGSVPPSAPPAKSLEMLSPHESPQLPLSEVTNSSFPRLSASYQKSIQRI